MIKCIAFGSDKVKSPKVCLQYGEKKVDVQTTKILCYD